MIEGADVGADGVKECGGISCGADEDGYQFFGIDFVSDGYDIKPAGVQRFP